MIRKYTGGGVGGGEEEAGNTANIDIYNRSNR